MKKILATLCLSIFASVSLAQITIPKGFMRYGGNYPLDITTVYTNYNDAVAYAAGGGTGNSSAYKSFKLKEILPYLRKASSIAFAAVFPAPIAEITVAAPVTASPPA